MRSAFIVGAGGSGFSDALALRSAGVKIAAVYDPHRERAEWLAGLTEAKAVATLHDEAADEADIVAICSPPAHHVTQAEALARGNRLTFLEKPIALDDDGLARLGRLPNVVPILQWRSGRSAHELREAFVTDAFGPAARIDCDLRLWRDAAYFAGRPNWGCGAMLSIGVHAIDLVLWMVGRPVIDARGEGLDLATRGDLELTFEGGATASIRITLEARNRNDLRLTVRGEAASADLRASEADPTATPIRWKGFAPTSLEGATGSPLLVPFIHAALVAPTTAVADVAEAHSLAMPTTPIRCVA